ncbi:MAG TPA: alpha/beta fold hydrolase, partial [Terriglobales bacterium]|nr:alpha/beta fold hydrolase [Terriglobales bacterium]
MTDLAPLPQSVLPSGIRSRFVGDVNGLRMHILEAGFEARSEKSGARPLLLLLHGFPELAYSWRKVMLPLAAAGFHVVAPDQRGYGRTTGWDRDYDGEVASFRTLNLVRDVMELISVLGYRSVHAVIGHDAGSPVAAWSSLIRPDVFRSVAMMSAPFGGPPALPFDTDKEGPPTPPSSSIHDDLAALRRPRKHYQWYYSTREANGNMWKCPQGVQAFMRAYYHYKSADWKQNQPFPLKSWTASELEKMPTYYIMDLHEGMAETVAKEMPSASEIAENRWLPENELAVYAEEYGRNGFQGGLQWYRCTTSGRNAAELRIFSGRTIDVPSCFIAGRSDWGIYQ